MIICGRNWISPKSCKRTSGSVIIPLVKKYDLIVCGGTFDLLHKGHRKFIGDVLDLSDKVLLGITSNSYISNFKTPDIEDFEIRKNAVLEYLNLIKAKDRVSIVSINQAYEPLLTSEFSPKAIAVTPQTEKTAIEINQKRKELGLPELIVEVIGMEKAQDGELISSTRIRNGEINREGRLYVRKSRLNKNLILPEVLRAELQKPFGKVLSSVPSGLDSEKIITIGDITTQKFNQEKVGQFLSIVDFQVNRKKEFSKLSDLGFVQNIDSIEVENPAGMISPQLFAGVQKAFESKDKRVILVKGEEDLSFLPVMLLAPLGFMIFYGQPDQGLVQVLVNEENKEKVYELVSRFM